MKNLISASGNTTVPMSRPSKIAPPEFGGAAANWRCRSRRTARTAGMVAITDAISATFSLRINGLVVNVMSSSLHDLAQWYSSMFFGSWPAFNNFNPATRYNAPVSKYDKQKCLASRLARVPLPLAADPSMAIIIIHHR